MASSNAALALVQLGDEPAAIKEMQKASRRAPGQRRPPGCPGCPLLVAGACCLSDLHKYGESPVVCLFHEARNLSARWGLAPRMHVRSLDPLSTLGHERVSKVLFRVGMATLITLPGFG